MRVRVRESPKRKMDSLVNAFPVSAISCGPFWPCDMILALKSSTAFPNHMRIIRKAVSPR